MTMRSTIMGVAALATAALAPLPARAQSADAGIHAGLFMKPCLATEGSPSGPVMT